MSARGAVVLLAVASAASPVRADSGAARTAIVRLAGPERAVDEAISDLRAKLADHHHQLIDDSDLQVEPGSPPAAELERARDLLDQAKDSYARFAYDQALAQLDQVDGVLADQPGTSAVRELLAERHLLAGLIHHGNGQIDRARQAFRMTRALQPSRVELDPGIYRPDIVALYRQSGDNSTERTEVDQRFERAKKAQSDDLRRPLIAARTSRELAQRAGQLAAAIDVGILVLVRIRGDKVEGARFDRSTNSLTHWLPIESDRLAGVLDLSPGQTPDRRDLLVGVEAAPSRSPSPAWYSTGWGKGLLIAGGVVAAGVIVYAVSAGEGEPTYDLGGWCFEGSCPQ